MSIHEEIKHYLLRGSYHWRTSNHGNPESRKSVVRRASKTYVMKDEKLYYRHQGKLRLVLFTRDQVREALKECHDNNQGTRGHPGRQRTYKKVSASYHWQTLWKDVHKWVDECPGCRHHERLKTVAPHDRLQTVAPVLRPMCVKEAWSVLQVDLIGPLPTTTKGKRFILMATDLFTRWVVAKPLYTQTACEVSRKVVNILLDLGLVQRIVITDQGPGFVDEVNRGVFEALGVRPCVTSYHRHQGSGQDGGSKQASHPQTSGQDEGNKQASHPQGSGHDEGSNQIIMDALSKYRSDYQNDWDVHLRGIVAAINTSKESSTKYTPYCALFGRHPRVSGDIKGKHREDDGMSVCVVMEETEEQLESRMKHVSDMHAKIYQNITTAQDMQRKAYEKIKESLPEPVLPEPWLHEHSYCTLPPDHSFQATDRVCILDQ